MPVPAMAEPVIDHQKRFQAAVDVIQNLPKNGMRVSTSFIFSHPLKATEFSAVAVCVDSKLAKRVVTDCHRPNNNSETAVLFGFTDSMRVLCLWMVM